MDRQKGFAPILILIVIVLLILGGYIIYKQHSKPTIQPQQIVQPNSTPVTPLTAGTFAKDLKASLEKAFK